MSDKAPITHEDLPHIATIEKMMDRGGPGIPAGQWNDMVEFVKHLRITAEADAPPLPEGWVDIEPSEVREGDIVSVYYKGRDDHEGHRYTGQVRGGEGLLDITDPDHGHIVVWVAGSARKPDGMTDYRRLTPLRPTITEADVERAMTATAKAYRDAPPMRNAWHDVARAAFKAAGIEVSQS